MKHYNQDYTQRTFDTIADNRGNVIAQLKDNTKVNPEIYLLWSHDRVEFCELDTKEEERGLVRIYGINSEGCNIQYRATQSLGGKQKERNLIATAHFSKEDLEYILAEIKKREL